MAGNTNTLAMDAHQGQANCMSTSARNAALWFVKDGYAFTKNNLNGRRVAGASFLKGFVDHAQVNALFSVTERPKQQRVFKDLATDLGWTGSVEGYLETDGAALADIGCLYYPSPGMKEIAWKRHHFGDATYSLCGITHTTATDRVMQAVFELRHAPVMDWDAVICTSRAVHTSITSQLDDCDAYLTARFGVTLPPRPQLPVIPLGVDTAAFAPDPAARAKARAARDFTNQDIVLMTLARLSPQEKFDPLPYFRALQEAQDQISDQGLRLHVVMCGIYQDGYSRRIFEDGSKALMPDVELIHLDGADTDDRATAFALADVFSFPIDNIQETFGLAPLEGMAAGLPILCSDWDGMKDTVSDDVGIRVPTLMASAKTLTREAWRYQSGKYNYTQYTSQVSGVTVIDHGQWVAAIVALASKPDLRAKLGAAGLKRVRNLYDWAAVIPQMQDLWANLAARRARAKAPKTDPMRMPIAPSPGRLFASYPTEQFDAEACAFSCPKKLLYLDATRAVDDIINLHRYRRLGSKPASRAVFIGLLQVLQQAKGSSCSMDALSKTTAYPQDIIERGILWLVKFGLADLHPSKKA